MQTHPDSDVPSFMRDELLEQLKKRAEDMTAAKENLITAGAEGEEPIAEWEHGTMHVRRLPEDAQGVLRVSVGGNVGFGYCVFRGSREACRALLQQAVEALSKSAERKGA